MFEDGTSRRPAHCGPARFYAGPLPWEEDDRWRACPEDGQEAQSCEASRQEPRGFLWRLSQAIFSRYQRR